MILLNRIIKNEDGQGLVEYGFLIGLVSLISIVALSVLGRKTKALFEFPEALPDAIEETTTNVSVEETPEEESRGYSSWIQRWLSYWFR